MNALKYFKKNLESIPYNQDDVVNSLIGFAEFKSEEMRNRIISILTKELHEDTIYRILPLVNKVDLKF